MKVANSYVSLLRGVSQQVPHNRAEGQHAEQVNMLSDPVNGLVRRHGSVWQAELATAAVPNTALDTDTAGWATLDYTANGVDYALLYRRNAAPAGATLPPFVLYNKKTKAFVPVQSSPSDPVAAQLAASGVTAITPVGKYLFMAGRGIATSFSTTPAWLGANEYPAVIWLRGGAYSRTFRVTVIKTDGSRVTVSHTTPSASYQGVLSTSDISATATDYTKQVNDRVNAYNSAVTAWIGTASAAVQPSTIAAELATLLSAAGVPNVQIGSNVCMHIPGLASIDVDDGGDGSLIRSVANEVSSADRVSVLHWPGKVVKVRGAGSAEAYYLKAVPKDTHLASTFQEVTWVEGAGEITTITGGLFYGTIHNGTFYYASSAAFLAGLTGTTHPGFEPSTCGDTDTSPPPFFAGRSISYLGTFQNRLLVGSGGVLSVSKTGDFLNFFRSTALTVPADDPFDISPQASEDDELQQGVLYDQDLVIFGSKRQYVILGTVALSPTAAAMPVLSNYEGVASVPPVAAGGFIFYAKQSTASTSVHQIQPGVNNKSPESFPASSQLDDYIAGSVTDMTVLTGTPSVLLLRTTGNRHALYTFAYLDRQDGRKMDSWSRWQFASELGAVIGVAQDDDGVLVFTTRTAGGVVYIVADRIAMTTKNSTLPYLDSLRLYAQSKASGNVSHVAYDSSSVFLRGGAYSEAASLIALNGPSGLWAGALQDTPRVTLTNPYMRDNKDKAILSGRLTVTKKTVAFKDSTGFGWSLSYRGQPAVAHEFNGRLLGGADVVGVEPVATGQHSVPVGREVREYTLTITARRWYPLTITAVEWVGQFFNRVQRF